MIELVVIAIFWENTHPRTSTGKKYVSLVHSIIIDMITIYSGIQVKIKVY
jgi:hypothetical protein